MGAAVLRDVIYPRFQCFFTKSSQGSNGRKSPSAEVALVPYRDNGKEHGNC